MLLSCLGNLPTYNIITGTRLAMETIRNEKMGNWPVVHGPLYGYFLMHWELIVHCFFMQNEGWSRLGSSMFQSVEKV